jgi:hypothetical protein
MGELRTHGGGSSTQPKISGVAAALPPRGLQSQIVMHQRRPKMHQQQRIIKRPALSRTHTTELLADDLQH